MQERSTYPWVDTVLVWTAVIVLSIIAAGAIIFIALPAARAHSFYPHECCDDRDCGPIASYRVEGASNGYLIDGLHFIPEAQARNSPDGQFHLCFPKSGWTIAPRCFFRPPMSM